MHATVVLLPKIQNCCTVGNDITSEDLCNSLTFMDYTNTIDYFVCIECSFLSVTVCRGSCVIRESNVFHLGTFIYFFFKKDKQSIVTFSVSFLPYGPLLFLSIFMSLPICYLNVQVVLYINCNNSSFIYETCSRNLIQIKLRGEICDASKKMDNHHEIQNL